MRVTKDQLIKENERLKQKVNYLNDESERIQKDFTRVLLWQRYDPAYSSYTDRPKIFSWAEIFFKIGELNSDANYAIVLGEKHRLQEENDRLKQEKKPNIDIFPRPDQNVH